MTRSRTRNSTRGAMAAMVIGASLAMGPYAAFAQGGTAPQSPSMGTSQSGSAIDSPKGADVSRPRSSAEDKRQFDAPFTGQPSGLGEKGSGQSQSTMDRSEERRHQDRSEMELQEGRTAQAMEQLLQEGDSNRPSEGSLSY